MNYSKLSSQARKKFCIAAVNSISKDDFGVYIFYTPKGIPIYIGKAKYQSLRKRLYTHYINSHNECLNLWNNSSVDIFFKFLVFDKKLIDVKERRLIKDLKPLCNKTYNEKEI